MEQFWLLSRGAIFRFKYLRTRLDFFKIFPTKPSKEIMEGCWKFSRIIIKRQKRVSLFGFKVCCDVPIAACLIFLQSNSDIDFAAINPLKEFVHQLSRLMPCRGHRAQLVERPLNVPQGDATHRTWVRILASPSQRLCQ